jgi:predicted MFS family arabinose efflux permease
MQPGTISLTLFVFGAANIIGNLVTGKLLTYNARKWVTAFPLALIAVYAALFFLGGFALPMILITFVWGILAGGIMSNINQYLISSAAPEAPEFANGLFIASCNIGTTIGSAVGGLLIAGLGIQYVVGVGAAALVIGVVVIARRNFMYDPGLRLAEE